MAYNIPFEWTGSSCPWDQVLTSLHQAKLHVVRWSLCHTHHDRCTPRDKYTQKDQEKREQIHVFISYSLLTHSFSSLSLSSYSLICIHHIHVSCDSTRPQVPLSLINSSSESTFSKIDHFTFNFLSYYISQGPGYCQAYLT